MCGPPLNEYDGILPRRARNIHVTNGFRGKEVRGIRDHLGGKVHVGQRPEFVGPTAVPAGPGDPGYPKKQVIRAYVQYSTVKPPPAFGTRLANVNIVRCVICSNIVLELLHFRIVSEATRLRVYFPNSWSLQVDAIYLDLGRKWSPRDNPPNRRSPGTG